MDEIFATFGQKSVGFGERLGAQYANIELGVYVVLGFTLPLLLPSSQLLTGTAVNAFLVLGALHFRNWNLAPIAFLPSIAALLSGMLFGPFTPFLLYMLPFIWTGNLLLIYLMKKLHLEKGFGYSGALVVSVLAKSALLFASAFLLLKFGLVPSAFLTAMGVVQVATGLMGGVVALLLRSSLPHLLK
ncbi:MAG: hypothetical protein PHS02_00315 [Candidatus ainarchaeum sp.]|nr:hypothetical protein [Candidatus ainarchaeum sp.]